MHVSDILSQYKYLLYKTIVSGTLVFLPCTLYRVLSVQNTNTVCIKILTQSVSDTYDSETVTEYCCNLCKILNMNKNERCIR